MDEREIGYLLARVELSQVRRRRNGSAHLDMEKNPGSTRAFVRHPRRPLAVCVLVAVMWVSDCIAMGGWMCSAAAGMKHPDICKLARPPASRPWWAPGLEVGQAPSNAR